MAVLLAATVFGACSDTTDPEDTVLPEGTIVLGVAPTPMGTTSAASALWRVTRDGSLRSHQGFVESLYGGLTPSPDHRRFAYVVAGRLVVDDARATRAVLFEPPVGDAFSFQWSPDGRHIAFRRARTGGGTDVSIARVADGAITTPTAAIGGGCPNDPRPQFFLTGWEAPDRFAFYWSICLAPDRYYVASAAGELEERPAPAPFRLVSPDGQRVLTMPNNRPTVSNADGTGARILANFPAWNVGATWSPSSRHVLVVEQAPRCAPLHLLAADGTTQYRIPDDPACPVALSWSPSGEWIATTLRDSTRPVLRLYRADGSEMREVPLVFAEGEHVLSAAWITE